MNYIGTPTLPPARLCLVVLLLIGIVSWPAPRFRWNRTPRTTSTWGLPDRAAADDAIVFPLRLPLTVMVQLLSGRQP